MEHGFRFLLLPLFFQNFHINHSFFKICIIIRFSSFDNISRRHTSWIIRVFCVHSFSSLYCISRKTVDTEYTYYSWFMMSTDIVKWRKTNDYENFEEGMINMKILKKGGNREKRGEEETKSMRLSILVHFLVFNLSSRNKKHYCLSTKQGA
jgi:hypothetical protein